MFDQSVRREVIGILRELFAQADEIKTHEAGIAGVLKQALEEIAKREAPLPELR